MARIIDPTSSEAIGTIKPWIRAASSVPIPTNWVICDGTLVVDPDSPFDLGAGFTVINLRSRFARGHASLTNANFSSNSNYILGGAGVILGGGDSHSHGGSTDSQGNHDHTGTASSHTHTISDDNHTHTGVGGFPFETASSFPNALSSYSHSHGGATLSASPSLSINANGSHGHNIGSDTQGNIPINYGLVYIMRIK